MSERGDAPGDQGIAAGRDDRSVTASEEDGTLPDDAFISPDDPIRPREPRVEEEGVATGIGEDPSIYRVGPTVRKHREMDAQQLAAVLERLARNLRDRGGASLLVSPRTPRFEAMLQGFLAGYLVGTGDSREE